jgi:hypothetical protein
MESRILVDSTERMIVVEWASHNCVTNKPRTILLIPMETDATATEDGSWISLVLGRKALRQDSNNS